MRKGRLPMRFIVNHKDIGSQPRGNLFVALTAIIPATYIGAGATECGFTCIFE